MKAKLNDEKSIEKILKKFEGFIVKQALKYKIKNYDFEDITQESNISIIKAIEKYDVSRNCFVTYCTSAIKNNLNLLYNSKVKSSEKETYAENIEYIEENNNLLEETLNNVCIDNFLDYVKEDEKKLIELLYVQNRTLNDACKILKLSLREGKNTRKRAIEKLRRYHRKLSIY